MGVGLHKKSAAHALCRARIKYEVSQCAPNETIQERNVQPWALRPAIEVLVMIVYEIFKHKIHIQLHDLGESIKRSPNMRVCL